MKEDSKLQEYVLFDSELYLNAKEEPILIIFTINEIIIYDFKKRKIKVIIGYETINQIETSEDKLKIECIAAGSKVRSFLFYVL